MKIDPVLIVEDNLELLKVLKLFLEQNGCMVETGSTAEEGMKKIRALDLNVILLDINLPDENGIDVLKQIKEISPHVPVIMITGMKDIEIATECMKLGAVDYITKPIDYQKLNNVVQDYLK